MKNSIEMFGAPLPTPNNKPGLSALQYVGLIAAVTIAAGAILLSVKNAKSEIMARLNKQKAD